MDERKEILQDTMPQKGITRISVKMDSPRPITSV